MQQEYKQVLNKLEENLGKYAFLLIAIMLISSIYGIYKYENNKFELYEKSIDDSVKHFTLFVIDNINNKYALTLDRILDDKEVIKEFENQNRNKLYLRLEHEWNFILKDNPYIKILDFHKPSGGVFLRMNKSGFYEDNIEKNSPLLNKVNSTHLIQSGFEQRGYFDPLYRIIKPIFKDKRYMGSIELGIDIKYILRHVKNITKIHSVLLLNKNENNGDFYDWNISNMVVAYIIDDEDISELKSLPKDYKLDTSIDAINYKNTHHFTPISLYGQDSKVIAKLLYIKEISEFTKNSNKTKAYTFLIVLSISILLYFLVKRYMRYFEITLKRFFSRFIQEEKEKKKYLQSIQNASDNPMVVFSGEIVQDTNQALLDLFGFQSKKEFKEKDMNVSDIFLEYEGYIKSKMDGTSWIYYVLTHPNIIHKTLIKKEDNFFTYNVSIIKFEYKQEPKYICTFNDITELEKLREENEYIIKRNEFAQNGSNIGVWDWDLKSDKVFYSIIWKSLLGYGEHEIKDELSEWQTRIHPDDVDNVIALLDKHIDGANKYFISEHRLLHKDGHYVYVSFRGQVLYDNNDLPYRMVGIYTDISQKKEALLKIKEQEELMMVQSRHAAMGEMIGMIAHQWRQPITSIAMGANNMLLDIALGEVSEDSLKEECNDIISQTKYLSDTIEDFRNFFKKDKDKTLVSIESVVNNALKLMEKSLEINEVKVETEFFYVQEIKTYPNEILQILLNLLKNAKEALIEKNIEQKSIKIYITEDEQYAYIDVADNAKGIPNEIINKIFEPYFTTKDEHNGTGLGLYMSKTVAQKHLGGDLRVKNSKNGAVFTISIKK